jgi:hypothetical protein
MVASAAALALIFLALAQAWPASARGATFGNTAIGANSQWLSAERKRVSRYALPVSASVSSISLYLAPASNSGQQVLEGIVYADSAGAPGMLLGETTRLTFTSTDAAKWYQMPFLAPLQLAAGQYWIGLISGAGANVAGYRYDTVSGARDYNTNSFASGPSNPFGSFSQDSDQMSLYATYTPAGGSSVPVNSTPPAIGGGTQSGQTLTASPGTWTESPTSFAYQWQRCNASGASCAAIVAATSSTYKLGSADVGSTLRVSVIASNAVGSSSPATSAPTGVIGASVPVNVTPPSISGTANAGQTLTVSPGTWTESPTSFAYQWQRCNASGGACAAIAGATASTYKLGSADVGATLRASVTASNVAGQSRAASSAPTAVVQGSGSNTFGKTTVGAISDHGMYANYKIVHSATLSVRGSVTKLTVYAIPGRKSPTPQALKAVIYAGSGGAPGALLATGTEVTYRGDVNGSGWFDLPLAAPVSLAPGTYWIGFITGASAEGMGYVYDKLTSSRAYSANSYASGATNPFGSATVDAEQASIYATYSPVEASSRPVNVTLPAISGTARVGSTLSASPGTWTESPTSYAYKWLRCDTLGTNCTGISGANEAAYTLTPADVGSTVRVRVIASNSVGNSAAALSVPSETVTGSSATSHLEYVLDDGLISVYDMDNAFALMKTISLPQTLAGIRGVSVCPPSHRMFISYGGDGGVFGNGSVLAYDLVTEKVVWEVHLSTGIDSGDVSPDCKRLYEPSGENNTSGIWNIMNTENGAIIGTIQGGSAAHNTLASADGRYVYLGGRQHSFLDVYETETGKVFEIGPLVGSVRPFTVNGSNTLAFTTATNFDGFQVSSIATRKVLFTTSFGEIPKEFAFTTGSHGISLSPDEKQLYVIDAVHKEVQFYNVSKVKEGVAPAPIAVLPVGGWSGFEKPCAYECSRGGWLQLSRDGRFLFAGDSGEVIETATRKVLITLTTLLNTKKSIEVDWQSGVPIATSGRLGVGRVP